MGTATDPDDADHHGPPGPGGADGTAPHHDDGDPDDGDLDGAPADPDDEDLEPVLAGRTVDLGRAVLATVALMFLSGAAVFAWQQADREPSPNEVDIGFADDMRPHHLQGVTMSLTYLERGTDPLLRQIAQEVIIVQAGEARVLSQWLMDWGSPDLDIDTAMGWMGMTPVPQDQQPGMATDEELAALEAAEGEELDELWSRLMIVHHRGGGHMASYTAEHAAEAEVRRLAESMVVTQRSEIGELNLRRDALGFDPA